MDPELFLAENGLVLQSHSQTHCGQANTGPSSVLQILPCRYTPKGANSSVSVPLGEQVVDTEQNEFP